MVQIDFFFKLNKEKVKEKKENKKEDFLKKTTASYNQY